MNKNENEYLNYVSTVAMVLKINSHICNISVISVIVLVVEGFRKSDETFFYLAYFPNLIAFPTSIVNLAFQIPFRFIKIKTDFFCGIREHFNAATRLNKLSFILASLFLMHHINYGIWIFNIF
tara:strand:- start:492 stop:860 length:369 start_codon:yes stop_codon:yes gene_type:complete